MHANKLFLATVLSVFAGMSFAADDTAAKPNGEFGNKWYVSPGVGLVIFRSDAPSHDAFAPMIRFGYDATELLSFEVGGLWAKLEDRSNLNPATDEEFNYTSMWGLWQDAIFHLNGRWERFDPFINAGIGEFWTGDNHALPDNKKIAVAPRLGIGMNYFLDEHWALRAGATLMDATLHMHRDQAFGVVDVGLGYTFGGGSKPMPPPAPVMAQTPNVTKLETEVKDMHASNTPNPDIMVVTLAEVNYDYDVSVIDPKYYPQLDAIAEVMLAHPESAAVIEGHADQRTNSSKAYNQELSERRAKGAADYLVKRGVDASRLKTVGYGFTRPKAKPDLVNGNPENRRVEIYINGVGGAKAGEAEYQKNLKK